MPNKYPYTTVSGSLYKYRHLGAWVVHQRPRFAQVTSSDLAEVFNHEPVNPSWLQGSHVGCKFVSIARTSTASVAKTTASLKFYLRGLCSLRSFPWQNVTGFRRRPVRRGGTFLGGQTCLVKVPTGSARI